MFELRILLALPLTLSALPVPVPAPAPPQQGMCFFGQGVDILRDDFGVPHVFGESDEAAYFGLGYACAEDRYFQMTYHRIQMEGRTAEFLERGPNDVYLNWDKEIRTYGYKQLADRLVANMSPKGFSLLQAYASGVDAYRDTLTAAPPLFQAHGLPYDEPWTIQSSVLIWLRVGKVTDSTQHSGNGIPNEIGNLADYNVARLTMTHEEAVEEVLGVPQYDEEVASVQESDVPASVRADIFQYASDNGLLLGAAADPTCQVLGLAADGPTFSEAWASNGVLTDDPALYGGPKTSISIPNDTWEGHMVSPNFNARGAAFPGHPNFFYGSTDKAAWSVTGLGMDQVDLFEIDYVPGENHYTVIDETGNSVDVDLNVDTTETILVKNESPQSVNYRETEDFGPIVTSLIGNTGGKQYASLSAPFFQKREPTIDYYRMYSAPRVAQFRTHIGRVAYPNANMVYTHKASGQTPDGSCGYHVLGSLPLRSTDITVSPLGGAAVQDGTNLASRWIEIVPGGLKPWVTNPASNFTWSANNLPVGAWYPIPFVRGGGYSFRGVRVLESLQALTTGSPTSAIRDIQRDKTMVHARDWAKLAIHLRDVQTGWGNFEPNEVTVIDYMEDLINNYDSQLDLQQGIAPSVVATRFKEGERMLPNNVLDDWTSEAHFLREKIEGINATPSVDLTPDEIVLVGEIIGRVWTRLSGMNPDGTASCALPASTSIADWKKWYIGNPDPLQEYCAPVPCDSNCGAYRYRDVKHWSSFYDTLPPLSSVVTYAGPGDGGFPTLLQNFNMGYSQFCAYGATPTCRTLLWYGQSEDPGSDHYDDQYDIWQDNESAVFKEQLYTRTEIEAAGALLTHELCWIP